MQHLFGLVLVVLAVSVNCDEFAECDGKPSEQFISDPNSCSGYIYCDGADSFKDQCPEGLYYDQANFLCDDPDKVNCAIGADSNTTNTNQSTASTTQISTSSQTSSPSMVPITTTLSPQTLPTLTATPLTSPTTTPLTTPAGPTIGTTICPPSSNNQPETVAKPDSCKEYYLCFNGSPILMECPNTLEYNSAKGQCDWAPEANCMVNPTTTTKPLDVCKTQQNGFFKYPDNCHYYYRCTNGMLTVQECPAGYGWDDNRRSCTPTGCSAQN